MSTPVTRAGHCPKCRWEVAFDSETMTFRCQNPACDYSRQTLNADPKDLVVVTVQPDARISRLRLALARVYELTASNCPAAVAIAEFALDCDNLEVTS